MIIWQGFGFLAPIVAILGYVAMAWTVGRIAGAGYLNSHSWPGALGTLIGAGLVWLLAFKLDTPGRTLLDQQTGGTVVLKKKHTFFFIPLKYCAIIFAVVALGMLIFKTDSTL